MSQNPAPYLLEQYIVTSINSPLLAYARNVTSQHGEDGILERIFEMSPPSNRYCVEFGAWDGVHLSNTRNLIQQGWKACLIEGDPAKFLNLKKTYADNAGVSCINAMVGYEGHNTLDRILASIGAPANPDLISIDIDGHDYFIWESLEQFLPAVLLIEFNPTVPNDVAFVQPKLAGVQQGCSLLALVLLGRKKGYELVCCTRTNAIFVRNERFPALGISKNNHFHLHQPKADGRIFQGYDGFIYNIGMKRLYWSGEPIDFDTFQMEKRK